MKCYEVFEELESPVKEAQRVEELATKVYQTLPKRKEAESQIDVGEVGAKLVNAVQNWSSEKYDVAISDGLDVARSLHQHLLMINPNYKKTVAIAKSFLKNVDVPAPLDLLLLGMGVKND